MLRNLTVAPLPGTGNRSDSNSAADVCVASANPLAHNIELVGRCMPVTDATRDEALAYLAIGRYCINTNFDDWEGYRAERERLLAALGEATGIAPWGPSAANNCKLQ